MKIEFTVKECIYLIPSITNESIVFLFWIFYFKKPFKSVFYLTPFIAVRYNDGIDLWISWIKRGITIRFELFRCPTSKETTT